MNATNRYEVALPNGTVYARNDKRSFTHAVVSTRLIWSAVDGTPSEHYDVNLCADAIAAEQVAGSNRSPWRLYTNAQKKIAVKLGKTPAPYYASVVVVAL